MKPFSQIKKEQKEFLEVVLKDPKYSLENFLAKGGLYIEDGKIKRKESDEEFEHPPMYKFFEEYDFEND